ncbi:alpha/beta fold hydrolase [Paenibacillus sp. SGZ-1009]|uniref:alpha/beta fold hydrolase n=1 Tax=Paenibacillus campi TaxID=3106031 RepID=UPI002AFED4C9|nr:alpha/beta fold hydrolase [Paenibacillus sp. SGZ-1009]
MMMLRHKWLAGVLALSIALPLLPQHAYMAPVNPTVAAVPGGWAAGQTPLNLSPDKPVLLFVHGLTSQAKIWYEDNDMYQYAYNNGYQTAFINMYDVTGTPEDMWKDGELLAAKIKEISQHYGGKKIVIIAHSKGGVDTQAALVRYNAYPYVSRVITLSTPHHGSELADLAYSSWAGWLAELVGSQNPGTSSLQTAYMQYFRSEMDKDPDVNKVPFYTLSGNKWSGSNKASYTFGGAYLSVFGSNDGVVTTASALLPGATLIRSGPWNHATVRTGSYTFNLFQPYIGTVSGAAASAAPAASSLSASRTTVNSVSTNVYGDSTVAGNVYETPTDQPTTATDSTATALASGSSSSDATADAPLPNGHLYVRGGQSNGTASEALTVEDGVQSITLDWISNKPLRELQLIAPDGKRQHITVQSAQDDNMFKGAYHHIARLEQPAVGNWQVRAVGNHSGAYLMTAVYGSSASNASLHASISGNGTLDMKLQTEGLRSERTTANYTVDYYDADGKKIAPPSTAQRSLIAGQMEASVPTPTAGTPSNYVITTDINGMTAAGKPYKRTLIKSVYVDANGQTYSESE